MKRHELFGQPTNHTDAPSPMGQGYADTSRRGATVGGRRLTDLFGTDVNSLEVLDELRQIQWFARQVIGDNLDRHSLERATLERLRTSILRQTEQAKILQDRIVQAGAGIASQEEIAKLCQFFEEALIEIGQQLEPVQ
ncbi:hypothetical protein [Rubellimicrobium roseum]|uniref:Uncharacterized protein n=1 Tax=Rubellimicrobium roseum TaxID=687525 RepID=A0A5C4N864_9RHOB|nr:hypothetical protein [Rubellimicrobium roseum]TNC60670.1 hypothetical protein FHG71_21865 [Rubellimicrobium roseum]